MKKELKNYLPFYLGCEVLFNANRHTLTGISSPYKTNSTVFVTVGMRKDGKGFRDIISTTDVEKIKLILRPLSDMTEEEMKDIVLANYSMENTLKTVNLIGYRIYFTGSGFKPEGQIDLLKCSAETFKCLLSKHFDLFGLIESGLAINAADIQK